MTQEFTPEDRTKAANNILEDLMAEKEKSGLQCQAIFNIMEDVNIAREELRNKYQDFEILQGLTQTLGFSFDVRAIMSSISDAIRKLSFEITISYVLVPLYQESSPVIVIDTDEQIGDEYIESIYNSICLTLKTKPNIEKNSEMLRYFMPGSVGDKLPFEFSRGSKNPDVRACPQFQTNIPLVVPGALSGLINISSQNPNCISPERMHVVHMLVQNAAQTIERMRVLVSSEQSRLQDLLSNMTDGVLLFEENGHIVVTNPCFKTMIESGFEHHSVQTIIDVLENNQDEEIGYKRVKLTQIIQGIFQKAESIRIDLFCFKQRVYEVNIVPVKNNQRGVSGTALIFHDITDRRRVDNLKDQFLNTVSHELRTPLAIIKGAAGNLKDGLLGKLNEQQQKVVEMLSANCVRLGRLINDLLDLSRLESGKAKVHKGQLDVPKLINETLATFQAQAQEKLITVSPQEKLPPVYADSDMIIQVLMNLINNSRRFAKSKVVVSSALCVMDNKAQSVSLSSKYDAVLVTVEDDGEGITLEDQAKLFNKFEQVNRPHGGAGYKGTGLGLSICREIIHLHGGSISVDSKLGNGTRFCFALPLYDETIFFHDSLRKSYAEAQKAEEPLSLVYCAIQNGAELKTKMGSNLKAILNTWAETLRKETLRKNDSLFVLEDGMSIVIVAPTAKTVAAVISERVLEKTRAWDFVMHAATASYPEDATNVQELLSHLGIGRNK